MRFIKPTLATFLLIILAVIGAVMNSRQVAAQGPADGLAVRIINPLPVPTTGSSTITGSVGVTQTGVWNVGITGQPVSFKNIDEPGRSPYQESRDPEPGTGCGTVECGKKFVFSAVPPNKRLVITDVSVRFRVLAGGTVFRVELITSATTNNGPFLFLPGGRLVRWGDVDESVINERVSFFVDQSQTPILFVDEDAAHVSVERQLATLTGYYVSLP